MSFVSHLRSLAKKSGPSKKLPAAPRCRPGLEILEDRCTPSSLSGYVRIEDMGATYGVPGVNVELLQAGTGTVVQQTKSASNGFYSFSGLPAGTYVIHEVGLNVSAPNRMTADAGTVHNKPDGVGVVGYNEAWITEISLGKSDQGINYDFIEIVYNTPT